MVSSSFAAHLPLHFQVLRAARRPRDFAPPPAARHAAAAARLRGGEGRGLGAAEAVGRRGGRKAGASFWEWLGLWLAMGSKAIFLSFKSQMLSHLSDDFLDEKRFFVFFCEFQTQNQMGVFDP